MAKLTAAQKKKMPKSDFGIPSTKDFPMNDRKHERLAIPMATKSYNAGNISKSTENAIKAKARKRLGISKNKKK